MKVAVLVKQVGVLDDDVKFTADGLAIDSDCLDSSLNEWDSCAIEEALRLREQFGGHVVAATYGHQSSEDALRACLAMGADRGVRVEGSATEAISVARALAPVVAAEKPDLVLCGAQSSDATQAATPSALAGFLGLPCVAVATKIQYDRGDVATVDRELESGLIDVVEVAIPAVLSVQTGINQPRYATLRAIKQAERQELTVTRGSENRSPASRVRRMYVPSRGTGAAMLPGGPADIAARILEIVQEPAG